MDVNVFPDDFSIINDRNSAIDVTLISVECLQSRLSNENFHLLSGDLLLNQE